jgi:hypothetical protein
MQIGRVTLNKFDGYDEMALLRHYLKKNHGFRHREPEYTYQRKAIINDGWKFTGPLIPESNGATAYVVITQFLRSLNESSVGEHFPVWLAKRISSKETSLKRFTTTRED